MKMQDPSKMKAVCASANRPRALMHAQFRVAPVWQTVIRQVLGIGVLVGLCGLGSTAQAHRLDEIKSRGTLVCATVTGIEPLAFQDPGTRQYVGFDIDTCNALAKRLGVSLEHKPVAVEARIPELTLGRVDVAAAALGYTKERATQIAFTDIQYQLPIRIMVSSASGIKTFAELAGKKVSANKGSTSEQFTRAKIPTAEVLTYQDSPSAFLALAQGKVQGLAIGQAPGVRFIEDECRQIQIPGRSPLLRADWSGGQEG